MNRLIKKYWPHVALIVMVAAVVGVFGMRYSALLSVTHAQSAPGVNISFDGVAAQLYLSPSGAGPTNEDFQVKVCFYDTLDSNGWGPACVTSPWASEAGTPSGVWTGESGTNINGAPGPVAITENTGNWSYWVWPGHSDEMGSATISVINTRPLPAGEVLSNVQLGIELAEDNSGGLVGTSQNLQADNCIQQFTPIGGGTSPTAYSYTYGDNCNKSPSGSPDVFRFYLGGTVGTRSVSMSSNIPSQMNSQQAGSYAITVKNTGNVPFVPTKWTFAASGPSVGNCDIDTDGDGVKDAPNPSSTAYRWLPGSSVPPPTYTCKVTGNATTSQIALAHVGSVTTPPTVNYELMNVTKTTSFTPGYIIQLDNSNPTSPSRQPNNSSAFIPSAYAFLSSGSNTGGYSFPTTLFIKPNTVVSYSQPLEIPIGGTGSFTVPITAPQASGQYSETWTFSDPLTSTVGPVAGGTYTIPITVGQTAPITVTSYLAGVQTPVPATWIVSGDHTWQPSLPTSSATYLGTPGINYTLGNIVPGIKGVSLKDVKNIDFAEAHRDVLGGLLAVLSEPLGEVAHAQTVVVTDGGSTYPPQLPPASYVLTPPSLNFAIQWTATSTPIGGGFTCNSNGQCVATTSGPYSSSNCNNACGGGSGLSATLFAYPSSGNAQLTTTLTATASGGSGTYNYTFWSNCSYTGSNVGNAIAQCGQPFKKDNAVTAPSDTAAVTYTQAGTDRPLVIVENGNGAAAAATTVTVAGGGGGICTPGATQPCSSQPNSCGQINAGTETCNPSGSAWSTCSANPPSNSSCVQQATCSSFTATSTTIVPGEQSTLSWTCSAGPCNIDNGVGGVNQSGTYKVAPTTTTMYTLTCSGVSTSTTVIVNSPSQREINP